MNNENLIHLNKRTMSERREIARKGGIASGQARQARKMLRDEMLSILEQPNLRTQICNGLIEKARKGNVHAFEVIIDVIGEELKSF